MGEALGELHFLLWRETASLYVLWGEFKCLFADSKSTVDLLNSTAPAFFGQVQHLFWGETLLAICRITDPPTSAGKANLSLFQLKTTLTDPKLRSKFDRLAADARTKADFARDWRNRHYAHRDLSWSKDPALQPLARANREKVDRALHAIANALNLIQQHFEESTTSYQHSIEPLGGAATLVLK